MDAFTELYRSNRQGIYNYFLQLSGDSHLAEELTHDTFLRAFRFFSGFRGDASARTWLVRIAINVWRSHCKTETKTVTAAADSADAPDPGDPIARSTRRMFINHIFAQMNERERTLIILRDINGLSYAQMASVLELNEGQVRVGLHRARKKFRRIYGELSEEDKG